MRVALACLALAGCGRLSFEQLAPPDADAEPTEIVPLTLETQTTSSLRFWDVFGTAPDAIYAVGVPSSVWFSTGDGTWIEQPTNSGANGLFGVRGVPGNLWTVGGRNTSGGSGLARNTGAGWVAQTNTIPEVLNVPIVFAPDNIYLVGYNGYIGHSTDGVTWTQQDAGTFEDLIGAFATGPNNIYVVGSNDTILHSTGDGTWTRQSTGTTGSLIDMWGTSPTDLYLVGHTGRIFHSTGDGTWTQQPSGTTAHLYAVLGVGGVLYVAGRTSEILMSRGDGVWQAQSLGADIVTIDALWSASSDRIYAAGGTATEGVVVVGTR